MLLKTASVYYDVPTTPQSLNIAMIVGFILGIIGAVLIYVLFMRKDNANKLKGFAKYLYDFLHFDKLCIEFILKITYIFAAIFLTVYSFGLIPIHFLAFLLFLIFGNVILRITYEMTMVLFSIHKNVKDINEKMKK